MSNTDFEDDMLSSIGEDFDGAGDDGSDAQGTPEGSQQDTTRHQNSDDSYDDVVRDSMSDGRQKQSPAQPVQGAGTQTPQQKQRTQPDQQQPDILRPVQSMPGAYTNSKGDLVTENGQMIARNGRERRIVQENARLKSDSERLRGEYDTLAERVRQFEPTMQALTGIRSTMQQHNITAEEAADAMSIVAAFKANPVMAAKEVVARAMALGHNASEILGEDVGNSVDMAALRQLMAGQTQQGQTPQAQQPAHSGQGDEHEAAANLFFQRHPDAKLHESDLAGLVSKFGITPYEAHDRLRAFVLDNNLDWSKPLKPQMDAVIQAHQAAQGQQPNPVQGGRPAPAAPMGRGGGTSTTMSDNGARHVASGSMSADASWNEIMASVKSELSGAH